MASAQCTFLTLHALRTHLAVDHQLGRKAPPPEGGMEGNMSKMGRVGGRKLSDWGAGVDGGSGGEGEGRLREFGRVGGRTERMSGGGWEGVMRERGRGTEGGMEGYR